ncbi:hypothetical protein V6N13_124793 [Hibiscus sabdariffa]|uniref:Uncharacterized protein n=1 Tax=Hibiscus sabdariffa TaxID=183260 RepID=A0ABR2U4A0_9ROSI
MPAGRIIQADTPSDAADKSEEATERPAPQSPAKRRRCYHIVSSDNGDDGSADPASFKSMQRRSTWIASHGEEKNFYTSKKA